MGGKLSYPQEDIPVDRTFIVTGGNTGIGYQTAKCIAKQGGRVIIACRSEERAKEAIAKMQTEHQEEVTKETQAREPKNKETTPATKDAAAAPPPADNEEDKSADPDATEGDPTPSKDEPAQTKEDSSPTKETVAADQETVTPPLKVEFMKLDLGSLSSTMEFVNAYKAKGYPLHVLVCNAGLGLTPFEKTDDGFELQFQVNYLSHFLMTLHLLPLLRESAPNSRIINLTSVLHTSGTLNLKNMQGEVSYDRIKNYGNSKLYQIMSMYAMSRRLKDSGISVFSLHPGYVDSEFIRGSSDSTMHRFADSVSKVLRIKRNIEDGAMTSLVAALDNKYDGQSGLYFKDCKTASPSALSRNVDKQEILWQYSLDCLKDHITEDLLKDLQLAEPLVTQAEEIADEDDTKREDKAEEDDATKESDKETKQDEGNKSTAEVESKPVEETELKPEEETEPKAAVATESKPEEETESKPEEETESKPEEAGESKPEEETESKPEEETESKPEEETESKPEDEPKPDEAGEPKPEEETESKPEEVESKPNEEVAASEEQVKSADE